MKDMEVMWADEEEEENLEAPGPYNPTRNKEQSDVIVKRLVQAWK